MIVQPFFSDVKIFRTTKIYKILHMITETSIPITSPANAAINIPLVFLILTQLVYTAMVYKVVSVDPIIVEAIIPIFVSTP